MLVIYQDERKERNGLENLVVGVYRLGNASWGFGIRKVKEIMLGLPTLETQLMLKYGFPRFSSTETNMVGAIA